MVYNVYTMQPPCNDQVTDVVSHKKLGASSQGAGGKCNFQDGGGSAAQPPVTKCKRDDHVREDQQSKTNILCQAFII